jgi:hypothetical protein
MAELELKRAPDDRRLYELDGVGTLRIEGIWPKAATAEDGKSSWRIERRGFWKRVMRATDAAGTPIGEFTPRGRRGGGPLHWTDHEFELRRASGWRDRYALVDEDRELAVLDGKGWGKGPVPITVHDPEAVDPGLLLFATYVVHGLGDDKSRPAAAPAGAASAGS